MSKDTVFDPFTRAFESADRCFVDENFDNAFKLYSRAYFKTDKTDLKGQTAYLTVVSFYNTCKNIDAVKYYKNFIKLWTQRSIDAKNLDGISFALEFVSYLFSKDEIAEFNKIQDACLKNVPLVISITSS